MCGLEQKKAQNANSPELFEVDMNPDDAGFDICMNHDDEGDDAVARIAQW